LDIIGAKGDHLKAQDVDPKTDLGGEVIDAVFEALFPGAGRGKSKWKSVSGRPPQRIPILLSLDATGDIQASFAIGAYARVDMGGVGRVP
jgi:hypothetical protein